MWRWLLLPVFVSVLLTKAEKSSHHHITHRMMTTHYPTKGTAQRRRQRGAAATTSHTGWTSHHPNKRNRTETKTEKSNHRHPTHRMGTTPPQQRGSTQRQRQRRATTATPLTRWGPHPSPPVGTQQHSDNDRGTTQPTEPQRHQTPLHRRHRQRALLAAVASGGW